MRDPPAWDCPGKSRGEGGASGFGKHGMRAGKPESMEGNSMESMEEGERGVAFGVQSSASKAILSKSLCSFGWALGHGIREWFGWKGL